MLRWRHEVVRDQARRKRQRLLQDDFKFNGKKLNFIQNIDEFKYIQNEPEQCQWFQIWTEDFINENTPNLKKIKTFKIRYYENIQISMFTFQRLFDLSALHDNVTQSWVLITVEMFTSEL